MMPKTTALLAAALLVLAGCGSSVSAEGDASDDTASDATDMGSEGGPDATPDPTPDGSPDGPPPDGPPPDGPPPDGPPPDGPLPDGPIPDAVPDGPPPTGAVGDPCGTPSECTDVPGTGRDCLTDIGGMLSFPGGYCSADCTSDSDCGTGGECVDLFGYMAYCLKACSTPGECRTSEGYSCTTIPGTGGGATYCLPPLGGPDGGPIDP